MKKALMTVTKDAIRRVLGKDAIDGGMCYNDKSSTYRRRLKLWHVLTRRITAEEEKKVVKAINNAFKKWYKQNSILPFNDAEIYPIQPGGGREFVGRGRVRRCKGGFSIFITEGKKNA